MAAAKKNHLEKAGFATLHQPKGGEAAKGCIWSWQTKYEPDHQCSYRWHGREHALTDRHLYNYPAYKRLCQGQGSGDLFETAAYRGSKAAQPSNNYALRNNFPFKKKPRPGQWNVELPRNFTDSFTRPYWHNSHHIIARSVLHDEILAAGKADSRVSIAIIQGLLMGTYNLNDKPNVVILPMDRAVASALGLPRHLLGHEFESTEDLQTRQVADHPDYSRRVKLMIRPTINQFKRLVMDGLKEDHPPPPSALAKEQLVRVSETIYKAITTAGKFMRGKSLDELRFGNVGQR